MARNLCVPDAINFIASALSPEIKLLNDVRVGGFLSDTICNQGRCLVSLHMMSC